MLEKIRTAEFEPQRKLAGLAESQLGTVGSGNHYVNLMEDEQGRVWVGVHFGSRGFGHKTASGFLALAQGLPFDGHATEGEMDSLPVLLELGTELGTAYIAAMQLAGEYAYAGRDVVVGKVLEILSAEAVHEVHNHHNFAWQEEHLGRTYWVIRKGCTPARPGEEGFVGGSMGDESVILEGVESDEAEESLFSTVHGAGRIMSRTQAAGRVRRRSAGSAPTATASDFRVARGSLPGASRRTRAEGVGAGAAQAGQGRLARRRTACASRGSSWSAVAPTRRRRCTSACRTSFGPRRFDPGEAHAAPARCGDGGPRRPGPIQGLTPSPEANRQESRSAITDPELAWSPMEITV